MSDWRLIIVHLLVVAVEDDAPLRGIVVVLILVQHDAHNRVVVVLELVCGCNGWRLMRGRGVVLLLVPVEVIVVLLPGLRRRRRLQLRHAAPELGLDPGQVVLALVDLLLGGQQGLRLGWQDGLSATRRERLLMRHGGPSIKVLLLPVFLRQLIVVHVDQLRDAGLRPAGG